MYARFLKYVGENRLFKEKTRVLVAVSGGVDSVVLLHLLCRASKQNALPLSIFVAHCNFNLRGEASIGDKNFVEGLLRSLNLKCFSAEFDTNAYAMEHKLSIEMAARELRYSFFERIMQEENIDVCTLAHHADDQAETQLINLLRGTGIKGLRGMEAEKGKYIRPLLFARRSEIEAYALANKLEWREDATNAQDDYLRNRIRHHLLPLCESLNQQAVLHMAQMADSFGNAEYVLESWYLETKNHIVYVHEDSQVETISSKKLKELRNEKGLQFVFCFFEWYLKEKNFSVEQIKQVLTNLKMGEGNKVFENRYGKPVLKRTSKAWIYTPL